MKRFHTEDGYTFYQQSDGTLTDTANPLEADQTYSSVEDLTAAIDAVEVTEWRGYAEEIITDPALFDGVEVQGVIEYHDDFGWSCEPSDEHPQFYSAYGHLKEGGVECIGDFQTLAEALAYANEIATKYGWPTYDISKEAK